MTTEKRRMQAVVATVYCSARKTNGEPCRSRPIRGGNVCSKHGGSAPQVREAARRRLTASVDRVMGHLIEIADDRAMPPAVRLAAIRDVLDRADLRGKFVVEVDAPWQEIIGGIVAEVGDALPVPASRRGEDDLDVIDAEVVAAAEDYAPGLSEPANVPIEGTGSPPAALRQLLDHDKGAQWHR